MSVVHLITNFSKITALGSQHLDVLVQAFLSVPETFKNVTRTDNKIHFFVFNESFVIKLTANYSDGFTYGNMCLYHIDNNKVETLIFPMDYDKIGNIGTKYTDGDFAPVFIQITNSSIRCV